MWPFSLALWLAATPVHLELERTEGAEGCATEPVLRALVVERLGDDPFEATAANRLRVRINPAGSGFEASVQLDQPDGGAAMRVLRTTRSDCADLGPALAFALSVAIDPMHLLRRPDAGAQVAFPASPPDASITLEPRDAGASVAPDWLFGAGGHAAVGAAPTVNGGVLLVVGLQGPRWATFLEGRADFPGSVGVAGGQVSARLLGALAYVCYRPGAFYACGFGGGGALTSEGSQLTSARVVTTPWVAVGARAAWAVMVSKLLGLRAHVDLAVPITRTVLRVGELDAWSTPPVSLSLGLVAFLRVE